MKKFAVVLMVLMMMAILPENHANVSTFAITYLYVPILMQLNDLSNTIGSDVYHLPWISLARKIAFLLHK